MTRIGRWVGGVLRAGHQVVDGRDVLAATGVGLLATGVSQQFGVAAAMIVVGVLCVVAAVVPIIVGWARGGRPQ